MKPWLKRTLVGVFGASLLFGGLAAWSHSGHGCGHGWRSMSAEDAARMKERMIERVASRLELDATQKSRLGTLADTLREQRNALAAGGDPRTEFAAVIAGPAFDRARASALVQAKTGAIAAASPAVITAMADFYDSLNPEQQTKVREFMARRGHHGWRG